MPHVFDVRIETLISRGAIATMIADRGYIVNVYHTIADANDIQLVFGSKEDMFLYALEYGANITTEEVVIFLKRRRL